MNKLAKQISGYISLAVFIGIIYFLFFWLPKGLVGYDSELTILTEQGDTTFYEANIPSGTITIDPDEKKIELEYKNGDYKFFRFPAKGKIILKETLGSWVSKKRYRASTYSDGMISIENYESSTK